MLLRIASRTSGPVPPERLMRTWARWIASPCEISEMSLLKRMWESTVLVGRAGVDWKVSCGEVSGPRKNAMTVI